MIVFLKLFVLFGVTFASQEKNNDEVKNLKRFGESSWQSPMENNYADPILAYITRLNSNLQPIALPYLDYIYNTYTSESAIAYFGDDAQEYLTTNIFSRRNAHDENEIIFFCEYLKCPAKTHSCESTIEVISEDDNEIQITTQCLSETNEVLNNITLSSSDISNAMYYLEIQRKDVNKPAEANDFNDSHSDLDHLKNSSSILFSKKSTDTESSKELDHSTRLQSHEIILYCDFMTCPSQTHICKSTFNAVPEDFIEIEVNTQCLSVTNEVLLERISNSKNPSNERYYYIVIEPVIEENIEKTDTSMLSDQVSYDNYIVPPSESGKQLHIKDNFSDSKSFYEPDEVLDSSKEIDNSFYDDKDYYDLNLS